MLRYNNHTAFMTGYFGELTYIGKDNPCTEIQIPCGNRGYDGFTTI